MVAAPQSKALNMDAPVRLALESLIETANSDTGQARRVANFLLAWWNAEQNGGFDLVDLANVDRRIAENMAIVFAWLARQGDAAYPVEYRGQFEVIIARWRPIAEVA